MRLFDRKAMIVVDTAVRGPSASATSLGVTPALQIPCGKDAFDCEFDIRKDLTGKPNRALIKIYNLNQDHRDALSERAAKGPVRVRLDAGYADGSSRIFEGDLRILFHDKDGGCDVVTTIESGDGDHIVSTARISKSWGPGTPVSTVIKDIAAALGVGEGNVQGSTAGALLDSWGPTYTGGTAVNGQAFRELARICKSSGILWSIQDGTLQFLVADQALSGTAVKVTASSVRDPHSVVGGMEDAPKIDHKGRLRVKTRIIPDIFPGRKIQLEDKSTWRVDKARYHGQTRGHVWNIYIEARPV
jgi:hypothetical protein